MNLLSGRDLRQGCRQVWASRLFRAALSALGGGLVLFHAWLLWQSFGDQSLFEPAVALKWVAAVALLGGVWHLRRRGHLVFRGHRAGVFWLLVLLLHVQLPMAPVADDPATAAVETARGAWLWTLPAGISLGAGVVLAFGLFLVASGRAAAGGRSRRSEVAVRSLGAPIAGAIPSLACRPPPLRA